MRTSIFISGLVASLAILSAAAAGEERFDPQAQAARHPIEMSKPAQDFFEGAVLGNGAMGVIVRTRPDSVFINFGHNDVWDVRVAENNREQDRSVRGALGQAQAEHGRRPKMVRRLLQADARELCQPYPRPWPCGSLMLFFDRRKAEVLGHRVAIDTGLCEVFFSVEGKPARLEVFTDMAADRLWMRMVDVGAGPWPRRSTASGWCRKAA